jgi:hypothetical protein
LTRSSSLKRDLDKTGVAAFGRKPDLFISRRNAAVCRPPLRCLEAFAEVPENGWKRAQSHGLRGPRQFSLTSHLNILTFF